MVTPEQVEKIRSLDQETDPVVKARKTVEMVESMLREYDEGTARLKELLQEAGLEEGAAEKFLEGDRVSQDARRDIRAAVDRQVSDIRDEATQEARRALGEEPSSEGPRPPRTGHIPV
jgi:hypothetical protein